MERLYHGLEVKTHRKGLHLSELLHMQVQNQISIQSCDMICSYIDLIPGEKKTSLLLQIKRSMFAQYFNLFSSGDT